MVLYSGIRLKALALGSSVPRVRLIAFISLLAALFLLALRRQHLLLLQLMRFKLIDSIQLFLQLRFQVLQRS